MGNEFLRRAFAWPPSPLHCKIIVVQSFVLNLLVLGMSIHACATPPQVTAPTDAGFPLIPACTAANLKQRLPIEGGGWLWCVETEDGPRWESIPKEQ